MPMWVLLESTERDHPSTFGAMKLRLVAPVATLILTAAACSGQAGSTAPPSPTGATAFPTAASANEPCDPATVPQDIDASRYGPGDLIAAREIPVSQLTGARAWRVLYVSIGVDDRSLLPVCGTVVAPDSAVKISQDGGAARVLTWSHGTLGVQQDCQPSTDPAKDIFGPQPNGIGAVGYGTGADNQFQGQPANGVLQTAINRGWTVAATDYYAGGLWGASKNPMAFLIGSISGAAVLDSARSASRLLAAQYGPELKASSYDVLTWGWSQGGHAAFWAAQLGRSYYARTSPKQFTPSMKVVGTAVVAPATTFVAVPSDSPSTWGTHQIDLGMHQTASMQAGGKTVTIPVGITLYPNFVGAWSQWSRSGIAPGAGFPAYPADGADLARKAIVTNQGIATTDLMLPKCVQQQAAFALPYANAAKNAYFVQPIWGQPGPNGQYVGQLDRTCNTTKDAGTQKWCSWFRYTNPGPAGINPFDKVPMSDHGSILPVFIGQGENDIAVHCVNTTKSVPAPASCISRQFFDDLKGVYCPKGSAKSALQLRLWRATPDTPAGHNDIPGLASDNGELGFPGSPLDNFISAVFSGNPPAAGCRAAVANP